MATATETRALNPQVRNLLDEVRARFRRYVWVHGLAQIVAWLAGAFWVWLLVDWLFEPPKLVRTGILAAAAVGAVYLVYRFLLTRVFVKLPARSMALLLERRFKDFDDSLLTAVELEERSSHSDYEASLLDEARATANRQSVYADAADVFDYHPLRQSMAVAFLLLLSIGALALMAPGGIATFFRRGVMLSNELWPRSTHLVVDGFDEQGRKKIARGSDFELVVRASTSHAVPETVSVRYRTEEGVRGRDNMSREGEADSRRDEYQAFGLLMQAVPSSRELEVVGGDVRLRGLRLEVVDSPTINQMVLDCRYPDYMQLAPRPLAATGAMQVPRGAQLTLRAGSNKPLVDVEVKIEETGGESRTQQVTLGGDDPRQFVLELPPLMQDTVLLFRLTDQDGISNREPIRLVISALPDQAPQITARPQGIGTAITPQARLPWKGKIVDDYGLSAAWFATSIDAAPALETTFSQALGKAEFDLDTAIEARDLNVKPGQQLEILLSARDNDTVSPQGANLATGEKFLLDVVTPDELRAMLASRELNLRRRLEVVIEEVTATRELLVRLDLSDRPAAAAATGEASEEADSDAEDAPPDPEAERRTQNSLHAERAAQNSVKNANESLGLAAGFEDICAELTNNRVESEELMGRLREGIAAPLRAIGEKSFPVLDERIELLTGNLAPGAESRGARDGCVEQVDAILREMQAVLERMLELETYNEVVELLRSIIEAQGDVTGQTQEERKQELRDLLEEDE